MRTLPNECLDSSGHDPERRCVLTGERAPKAKLIRLALGPDGQIAPDVRAKAPGRGAWVGVDRVTLAAAQAKGKLKGVLIHTLHAPALQLPDDLAARTEAALERATLDRFGMEARAGHVITGSEAIAKAARVGDVHALFHASDAVLTALKRWRKPGAWGATRKELGFMASPCRWIAWRFPPHWAAPMPCMSR